MAQWVEEPAAKPNTQPDFHSQNPPRARREPTAGSDPPHALLKQINVKTYGREGRVQGGVG